MKVVVRFGMILPALSMPLQTGRAFFDKNRTATMRAILSFSYNLLPELYRPIHHGVKGVLLQKNGEVEQFQNVRGGKKRHSFSDGLHYHFIEGSFRICICF